MGTMGLLFPMFLVLLAGSSQAARYLQVLNSWSNLEFTFPNVAARQAMIQQGYYVPGAALPIDVDVHNDRVFMTMPRLAPGIPATLTTLSKTGNLLSPTLDPYPDWSWHRQGQCNGITSVFRVQVDECGRLWVLDTGSVDIFAGIKHICPKQLLIFNLANDKLVTRHRFDQSVIKPDTLLVTIAVDVRDPNQKCRSTFAYVADVTTYGLIVYDARQDKSWRITANSFYPIPFFGHFDIQGSEFDLMDGLLGLTLSPQSQTTPRTLYYHSLASNTESFVSTAILRNESLFANNMNSAKKEFYTYPNTRVAQAAAQAMSSNGVLFFSELTKASLNCWNTRNEYGGNNLVEVDKDYEHFQFAAGLKVIKNREGVEEVWALTDRLQRSAAGTLDKNEVNFRILKAPVQQLVAGTKCAVGGFPDSGENFINGGTRPGGFRPTRPTHRPTHQPAHQHTHHHHGGTNPFTSHLSKTSTTVRVASVDNSGPIIFKTGN